MSSNLHSLAMDTVLGDPYGPNLAETFYVPGRPAKHVPIPRHLRSGSVGQWIDSTKNFRDGFWNHQGLATGHLHDGENVCTTTTTSSGKTEINIAHGLYLLDQNPSARIIGIHPSKALQADQADRWEKALVRAGRKKSDIDVINGDIKDHAIRTGVIDKSKVVLITPDVMHAWLLANLKNQSIRGLLRNLEFMFLDEVHTYNEILGSQAPFLFRRLQYAVDVLKKNGPQSERLQISAASASLKDAPAFMRYLTGQDFVEVGADQDGSHKFDQDVLHLAATQREELAVARNLICDVLKGEKDIGSGTLVCFIDSRQQVERLASDINARLGTIAATTFIGGYSEAARDEITFEIKNGTRRAVISTSVLEMGVHFEDMAVGVSVGRPHSPTALQQRLGRVGRGGNGLYIVIAPPNAFIKGRHPISLKEYCQGGAEMRIHTNHPLVLGGNAHCLQHEIAQLGLSPRAALNDRRYHWGDPFLKTMGRLRAGLSVLDEEAAEHLRRKGRSPHRAFGLRQLDSSSRSHALVVPKSGGNLQLGYIPHRSAVHEAYPGAIYHHRLEKYEVQDWTWNKEGNLQVVLKPTRTFDETYALREKWVNADIPPVGKRLSGSDQVINRRGRMVECTMGVNDRVIGFVRHTPRGPNRASKSDKFFYHSKKAKAGEKRQHYQNRMQTTGVVLDFRRDIFEAEELARLGQLIKQIYCELHNITPANIDYAHGRVYQNAGKGKSDGLSNALVIFDKDTSGFRLTRQLIRSMPQIIEMMAEYPNDNEIRQKLKDFYENVTSKSLPEDAEPTVMPKKSSEEDTVPPKTIVWFTGTKKELGKKKVAKDAARTSKETRDQKGEWMTVVGFETSPVDGTRLYQIQPWQDPTKTPKRPQPGGEVKRLVPRSSFVVVPNAPA